MLRIFSFLCYLSLCIRIFYFLRLSPSSVTSKVCLYFTFILTLNSILKLFGLFWDLNQGLIDPESRRKPGYTAICDLFSKVYSANHLLRI